MSEKIIWEYFTAPVLIHATKQILDNYGSEGWELVTSLRYPGGRGQTGEVAPGESAPVGPGAQVVVFLWLKADPERLRTADALWHVVTVAQSDSAGQTNRMDVPYGPVPLASVLGMAASSRGLLNRSQAAGSPSHWP